MTARDRIRSEKGFGLVEVMTGVTLLIVGALGVLGILMSASKASTSTDRQEVAIHQAEKQMEFLRSLPYDRLWMASVPAPGTGDEPTARIAGAGAAARYEVGNDPSKAEELVTSGSTAAGWTGVNPGTSTPVTFSVGTGSSAVTGKVYTFVSWRDQECPVLAVGDVSGTLQTLSQTGGVLPTAAAAAQSIIDGISGSLVSADRTATTKKLIGEVTDTANKSLPELKTLINSTSAQASSVRNSGLLSGGLDLCDLDASKIAALKRLTSVPTGIQDYLQSASNPDSLIKHKDLVSGLVTNLLNVVGSLTCILGICPQETAVNNEAGNTYDDMTAIKNAVQSLGSDLTTVASLLGDPQNTTHNTKRVTVAVTIDSVRADIAPQKPIWTSSVVVDPDDGIL